MNIFSRFWRWLLGLFWTKELTITIVGLPNAGKSTLVRAIANENTEEATVPTIGANVSSVTVGNVVFKIHDIGGHQMYHYLWEVYCQTANVVVYVLDSADSESIGTCEVQIESLFNNDSISSIPIIIVANKQDLPGCLSSEELQARLKIQQNDDRKVSIFSLSAKTKANLEPLVRYLIDNF